MTILVGDCLLVMPTLAESSIDAIVCDPPYGLGFMGKDWDHGVPGEHFWREALRVAKPGAHLVAFGGTRTFHRLACAIEDAGWEIRDTLMWVYGSGFPKSLDVSKAIDKAAGAQRAVVGRSENGIAGGSGRHAGEANAYGFAGAFNLTEPATEAAKQWEGWGTALKPAWEPIILARKPLSGTVASNVQRFGTGAMNIDGCRVGVSDEDREAVVGREFVAPVDKTVFGDYATDGTRKPIAYAPNGRWPANLIHDGSEEVVALFPSEAGGGYGVRGSGSMEGRSSFAMPGQGQQVGFGDSGSAARFFYSSKASAEDRHWGTDIAEIANAHPTVKPHDVMRWLCRLVTPPGGLILDPFCGSGSTGRAALAEGFRFVGIELDPAYAAIAEARIHATQPGLAL